MEEKDQEKSPLTIVKDEKEDTEKKITKPTPEEIEKFKNDFTDSVKKFEDHRWQISEPGQFGINDVGMYLLDFMNKYAFWSNTKWMGLIKMEDEIKKAIKMSDPSTGIALSYQALEFCAYMLENPGGTGLKLAKQFEDQADKYAKIGMVVGTQIEDARKALKNIQYKQDVYAASEQGVYLDEYLREQEEKNKRTQDQQKEEIKKDVEEKLETKEKIE